jgi:hypothetical protein
MRRLARHLHRSACRALWLLAAPLVLAGCAREPVLSDMDAGPVAALKPYDPICKLDNVGRVIHLKLEGRHVDDQALEAVKGLTELRGLSLHGASVTDQGLEKIRGLKLERLGLTSTRITDKGLEHVETLIRLRQVWLMQNPQLSSTRIAELKKNLHGLIVHQ